MNNNSNFETYLFISSKRIIISVYKDLDGKVYQEELSLEKNSKEFIFEKLDYFLNQHILKIEKKLKNFIKKISLILDLDVFFPIEISVKKNNYDNPINLKILNHLLHETKDYCKKTLDNKRIIHMLIISYQADNKSYSFLPKHIKCNNFSINVKFYCISNILIKNFENILKKYQISLNKVVNNEYLQEYLSNEEKDIFLNAKKIINGHNPNEVMLVEKIRKNDGFFEKFFNFFN